ncbi:MAG: hypothetical protein KME45_03190 [Stenomitos rutilans HA7619-LM2]|nr:hypothetical protein [Stenomitos rutilans HA7619-LM2]MBW4469390.1 hypothetical protein [Stenomitos rutilans HA7619-LM2]
MQQMQWRSPTPDQPKLLYLNIGDGWKPYTQFPQYQVPDYRIPGASKGFATMQALLKRGFALLPSGEVMPKSEEEQRWEQRRSA